MELQRNQWYVAWFFGALAMWDEFCGRPDTSYKYEERGTNLCHLVRVMTLYAAIVIVSHAAIVVAAIFTIVFLPPALFGTMNYLMLIAALVFAVILGYGIKVFIERREAGITPAMRAEAARKKKEAREAAEEARAAAASERGPGFFEIVWRYVVAAKQKTCPTITFHMPNRGIA
ncbi:MAG: hypothetical protein KBC38_03280 [Candidatus Pacebacteria bacterium]|nr:hypothetical protein [Candidatus Paceibacterota bacterium]MBP9840566.1 hypothetical protein [Candidatus Paceibacterota bacterium]